jgi:hypothetical protein
MRRYPSASDAGGSSVIEVLLVGILALSVIGAVAGVVLLSSIGPRSSPTTIASVDPAAASSPEIEISCGAGDPAVAGSAVDATSAGAAVAISGREGALLSFVSPGVPGYRMHVVEPSARYELPLPPGTWTVGCAASGVPAETSAVGAFAVRDPGEVYVRTKPDCPETGCCDDSVTLPEGFAEDDLGTLREGLEGVWVRPDDVIERAAYPGSRYTAQPPSPLVYRVVRDLRIVARLDVASDGDVWTARVLGCPSS